MPVLLIMAGCNGAGKSTFSAHVAEHLVEPYDDDLVFKGFYEGLFDSDIREEMARNMTTRHREDLFNKAMAEKRMFSYETNFSDSPMYWPDRFEAAGFDLRIRFFCLKDVEQAKERVRIRVANGGHWVSDAEIERRFNAGYQYLDEHFRRFSHIDILDSSGYDTPPRMFLSIQNGTVKMEDGVPDYICVRLPIISALRGQQ